MQAWLEAYHSVSCGKKGVLHHGDLNGRAGAIQAAINLELHTVNIGRIDVKIEGLNGQLPNLDLFNLVNRLCIKEHLEHTFKNSYPKTISDPYKSWLDAFKTLIGMVSTQATSVITLIYCVSFEILQIEIIHCRFQMVIMDCIIVLALNLLQWKAIQIP